MRIVAYCYCDPLLERLIDPAMWGVEVDKIYTDFGDRQQLQQLVKDAQTQAIDYCLVRNLGELADSPTAHREADLCEIAAQLTTLEGLGITVIALEQDYASPQSGEDGFNQRQQWTAIFSQLQLQRRRQALQRGHARKRLQLLPPPGKAPYGYRRSPTQYVLDKATAPIVKAFFERFILSGSLRGSVRYIEQTYYKKMAVSTAKRWLTHPVYRGDLLYQNQTIIPDTHPPLLTRLEAAQIDRLLRRNAPLAPRTASAPRSLAGLVHCQRCQTPWQVAHVTSRHQAKDYCYLRPKACAEIPKCKAIAYQEFLDQTIDQICRALPITVENLPVAPLANILTELKTAIADKQGILQQLPALESQGILDPQTHQLRRYGLKAEIAQLQQRLDQLPPDELQRIIPNVSLPQFWRDLSETERRFYFREFIQQIQVNRQPQSWALSLTFVFGQLPKIPPEPSHE
ncbi:MAG: recombinase family protein [Synechocystis sp.]|nr:recombinase family protein [Synechocystis sp.]